jgi:hypothetical protein
MPLFPFFITKIMHIRSTIRNSVAMFSPITPYTLAGFDPGPSVSEAYAMSTAPRHQDIDFLKPMVFVLLM